MSGELAISVVYGITSSELMHCNLLTCLHGDLCTILLVVLGCVFSVCMYSDKVPNLSVKVILSYRTSCEGVQEHFQEMGVLYIHI